MNTFEDRLLAELKDVVVERATAEQRPAGARRRPVRRLGTAAAVVAAAAGITAAIPLATGEDGDKANAVERRPDGSIAVHLREFNHPERVEARLRGLGVPAQVNFIPSGQKCKPGRAKWIDSRYEHVFQSPGESAGSSTTIISPRHLKPGQTVAIDVWAVLDKNHQISGYTMMKPRVAPGPVAPCVLVPGGPEIHADWAGDGPNTVEDWDD
ncbi:hypothetical protein [Actinomadura rubrisoli]|uniref:Uncharacterized protein n=1 Tax=Actinomadura rubrisoli TaxID=2530368 RepID=A0A4R5AL44_9ACTN|nr:hypothetical protein [Actinomadura rubrisoli]TDD72189.1 hypothetical protein E1298_35160 [Actinomadura rubrisoli]